LGTTSLLILFSGCILWSKPPPDAPDDLEELCKFVFAHFADDDDTQLREGLENLHFWLHDGTNLESTLEGYQIQNLEDESVAGLDEIHRTIGDQLGGAAIAYSHIYSPEEIAGALFIEDWSQVSEGTYDTYDRQFDEGPDCIADRSCEWLSYTTESTSTWAFILTVESVSKGQVRWVETDHGWMLLQRTWMYGPAEISWDEVEVDNQFFMSVVMPECGNSSLRTSATWIDSDYGSLPVDEDWAKNQVIQSMQDQDGHIDRWLSDK